MRPPFSISQITTLGATFEADLRAYAAAGVDGIGIWEIKLPEGGDDQAHEQLEASGLGRAAAVPAVPSILPLPLMEGPADPRERIDAICASVHRLARFEPSSVVCLTGPGDDRDTVVEGLRTIGDEAARAGVRIGLEPINRVGGEDWTSISSLQEAAELLDDADRPALGIQFDSWHVWNTPERRRGDRASCPPLRRCPHRRLARADARLGGPGPARRRRRRPPGAPRYARTCGVGRVLRPGDLFGQRDVWQRLARLALGRSRRGAGTSGEGGVRACLVGTKPDAA